MTPDSADTVRVACQRPLSRILLFVLALSGLGTGGWAAFVPESFYTDFPGFRSGWVSADGPFNEHLIRDVGAMFVALGVLALVAACTRPVLLSRLAGLTWLIFGALHFVYHIGHLGVYSTLDKVINVAGLAAQVVIAAAVVLLPAKRPESTAPAPEQPFSNSSLPD